MNDTEMRLSSGTRKSLEKFGGINIYILMKQKLYHRVVPWILHCLGKVSAF